MGKADKRVRNVIERAEQALARKDAMLQRQKEIIDRLVSANAVYADLTYGITHEAESLEQAKEFTAKAMDRVKEVLAVPADGEDKSGD